MNKLKPTSLVLFIAGILISGLLLYSSKTTNSEQTSSSPAFSYLKKKQEFQPITMIFFGDIMLDRGVKNSVRKNFGDDFNHLFDNLPEIKEYDIAFANLEGPVSERGHNVGSKFSFRFEPRTLDALRDVGFDIVSSANNHAGDWTYTAFIDTLDHLKTAGILSTGGGHTKIEAETPGIINVRGTKIGFLGFTDVGPNWLEAKDDQGGILLANDPRFAEIISNAKTQCDFLIISFHWGEEYQEHNARQRTLAHSAIDSGADMIIGHHPHVEQATEWYSNKFIAYSLGNFIFDQYFSPETMQGLVIEAKIQKDKTIEIEKKIVQLSRQYQPQGIFEYDNSLYKK